RTAPVPWPQQNADLQDQHLSVSAGPREVETMMSDLIRAGRFRSLRPAPPSVQHELLQASAIPAVGQIVLGHPVRQQADPPHRLLARNSLSGSPAQTPTR